MAEKVGGIEYSIDVDTSGTIAAGNSVKVTASEMTSDFIKVDNAVKNANATQNKLPQTASKVSKSLGGVGRSAGMASIQLQQMVGQVQGGVNPMIALSQQGADLGIVLGLPLLGSIIGIGAALATNLVPNMANSTTAAEDLSAAIEALKGIAEKGERGLYEFSDAIAEMSDVSKSTLLAGLELGLIKAEKATAAATKGIIQGLSEIDASYGIFGGSDIEDYINSLNNMEKSSAVNIRSQEGFIQVSRELGEQLGLTGEDARKMGRGIIEGLAELQKNPSSEGLTKLQKQLTDLTAGNENVSTKVKELIGDLAEMFATARSVGEEAKFIQEQIDKLSNTGDVDLKVKTEKLTEAQEALISIGQEVRLTAEKLGAGENAARRLAIAFSLGKESAEEIPVEIREALTALEEVEAKEKAIHDEKIKRDNELRETKIKNRKIESAFNNLDLTGGGTELEALEKKLEEEREIIKEHFELKLLDQELSNMEALLLKEQYLMADAALEEKYADLRDKIDEAEKKAKVMRLASAFGDLSSLMNSGNKKQFEIGKKAALAQAGISGVVAAIDAFKAGMSVGGPAAPAFAAAYAAASLAKTGAMMSQINSQSFGSSGSPTSFSGGVPAVNTQQQQQTNQNITIAGIDRNSLISGGQLIDTLNTALGDGYTINLAGG